MLDLEFENKIIESPQDEISVRYFFRFFFDDSSSLLLKPRKKVELALKIARLGYYRPFLGNFGLLAVLY